VSGPGTPETVHLDLDDLLEIARRAVGGEPQVRDHGLLASAVARPQTTVFGADAYPSVLKKAAALCESLTRNHGLADGNKRLAWLATWVFCDLNDIRLVATQDEVVDLIVDIAEGSVPELRQIVDRLAAFLPPAPAPRSGE
jgi:death on curing protein